MSNYCIVRDCEIDGPHQHPDANSVSPAQFVERHKPSSLLEVIAAAVADPRVDVDKMSKLLDVQERIVADQRRTAFMAAMARLTPKLAPIGKYGVSHHGKYVLLEDIDRALRPLMGEEGFSMSFDSEEVQGGKVKVVCRLSHAEGYSETKQITLAVDNSGSKNASQAVISAISYGRRTLMNMFFNLVGVSEDDDGNGGSVPITEDKAKDLEAALTELPGDPASNMKRFLKFMNVNSIREITELSHPKAIAKINEKRRAQ